jgi:hypothetical protein
MSHMLEAPAEFAARTDDGKKIEGKKMKTSCRRPHRILERAPSSGQLPQSLSLTDQFVCLSDRIPTESFCL